MKTRNFFTLFLAFALSLSIFTACDNSSSDDFDPSDATITELALENESLSILADALTDAGLADDLDQSGSFTVFAPSNTAFSALPSGLLSSLTNEQLEEILTYHVIAGAEVRSGDLLPTQDAETLNGEEIRIDLDGSSVLVNGSSRVTQADVDANNGVIHIVDQVLLPKGYRDNNIIDQAENLGTFTALVGALEDAGLSSTLKFTGDYTVFAPTDDAFNALPAGLLSSLSPAQLSDILTYHVLNGEVFAGQLNAEQAPVTLNSTPIFVTADGGNVTVNGNSSVVTADVNVSNGVIHAIDRVLLPDAFGTVVDAASKRYFFETLVQAVVDAQLATALSDENATLTVFAPTDEAFANLPDGLLASLTTQQLAEILQYHVLGAQVASGDLNPEQEPASLTGESVFVTVDNGDITVNGSSSVDVNRADITTNNGIIHTIDRVLLPDAYGTIVDAAAKRYFLSSLVGAVVEAQLDDDLSAAGPFTVFAPTNEAFAALPAVPTGQELIDVLTYHVIPSQVLSGDLQASQTVTTLNGATVDITVSGDTVTINGTVEVSRADLQANNGVIHVIDGVLLPPSN